MSLDWSSDGLAEGLRCFRAGEFFLAHEHWEAVWLRLREPEKTFLQALIQIAGAFHHFQRDNLAGTESLLRAALRRLDLYEASFAGIHVAALRKDIHAWLKALAAPHIELRIAFPVIQTDRLQLHS